MYWLEISPENLKIKRYFSKRTLISLTQCRYVSRYLFVNGDFYSILAFRPLRKRSPVEIFEIGGSSFLYEGTKTEVLEERRKKYPDTCGESLLNFKRRFLLRKLKRKETNLKALFGDLTVVVQPNTVNKNSDEGGIESVCINGVSVLSGLILEKM